MRDGIVLGAAVGFGFAAFESAGYAFNALFTAGSPSLLNLVQTEVLRRILTPVGHGLWDAFALLSWWGLLALDGLLGVLILRHRWHRATTLDRPRTPASLTLVATAVAALLLAGCSSAAAGTGGTTLAASDPQMGGAAAGAGLRAGELGTAVQGTATPDPGTLADVLAGLRPGQTVTVRVARSDGGTRTAKVTLGQFPG